MIRSGEKDGLDFDDRCRGWGEYLFFIHCVSIHASINRGEQDNESDGWYEAKSLGFTLCLTFSGIRSGRPLRWSAHDADFGCAVYSALRMPPARTWFKQLECFDERLAGNNDAPQGCYVFRSKDRFQVNEAAFRKPARNDGVSASRRFLSSLASLVDLGHGWAFPEQSDTPEVLSNLASGLQPFFPDVLWRDRSLSWRCHLVDSGVLEGERFANYSIEGLCNLVVSP
jgi:hypothetical protein